MLKEYRKEQKVLVIEERRNQENLSSEDIIRSLERELTSYQEINKSLEETIRKLEEENKTLKQMLNIPVDSNKKKIRRNHNAK